MSEVYKDLLDAFDELADIYNNKSLKDKVAQAKAEYINESLQNLSNSDLDKCEKDR